MHNRNNIIYIYISGSVCDHWFHALCIHLCLMNIQSMKPRVTPCNEKL